MPAPKPRPTPRRKQLTAAPAGKPRAPRAAAASSSGRVTIRDIATVAGVTSATVSYVLSGNAKVKISDETRARVRDAAAQLGYTPDLHARSLVTGRTMTIGVCFGATGEAPFSDDYDRQVLHGLVRGTALAGYALQVLAQPLAGVPHSVDGWVAVQSPPDFDRAALGRKPVVFLDPGQPIHDAPCVWARNAEAGALVADAVLPRRNSIAFVLHEPADRAPFAYRERLRGFCERALAIGGARVLTSHVDPLDETALRAWVAGWSPRLRSGEITHVACVSDMLAARLSRLLLAAGLKIPGDVGLTGFDNTLHSQLSHPAISTVEVGAGALAEIAVGRLVAILRRQEEDHEPPAPLWIPRDSH